MVARIITWPAKCLSMLDKGLIKQVESLRSKFLSEVDEESVERTIKLHQVPVLLLVTWDEGGLNLK